jgi:hypothetical protein
MVSGRLLPASNSRIIRNFYINGSILTLHTSQETFSQYSGAEVRSYYSNVPGT